MKRMGIIFIGLLIASTTVYGAFDDVGWTARSRGMGNAMFGDFGGVDSMNYNPATISMEHNIQVYGAWDNPYGGLDDGSHVNVISADIVLPFFNSISLKFDPFVTKRAALGFSVRRLSVTDPSYGDELYHEGIYSMIYAKDLNDVISRGAKISAGVRLSIYDLGVGLIDDVQANPYLGENNLNRLSFGLDVGVTYDFSETIRLGLAYKNLIAPVTSILTNTDKMPTEFRLGGNWQLGKLFFMKDANLGFGLVTYGRDADDNRKTDSSYNVGYEFEIVTIESIDDEIFAIRLGGNYLAKKNVENVIELAAGLGFKWIFSEKHEIKVDYAVEYSVNMGSIQHTAGMTYEYYLPNSAFAYKEEVKNELVFEELLEEQQQEAAEEESEATDEDVVEEVAEETVAE